jgi:ketosteroid isomerase-like protein
LSAENVEIVRAAWEAYENGDLSGAIAPFADEMITHRGASIVHEMTFTGPEGALDSLLEWAEQFDEFEQTVMEVVDAGDHVLCKVHQTGFGVQSGAAVEGDFWFALTLREGKVVRLEMHTTKEDALKAAEEAL